MFISLNMCKYMYFTKTSEIKSEKKTTEEGESGSKNASGF